MHYNIIYKDDNAYKIIREIPTHNFQNKDGSIHQQVLGMYVHELDCDRVFRENNHFLICKKIAEGTIIQ
tara:strand:+ start:246 stop:452 length:207 start_codon:yes stop_codon:yes gene_type:complete